MTYTMSAHLCKQIYASWRQTRQTSPDRTAMVGSPPSGSFMRPFSRSPSPPAKRSSIEERRPSSSSSSGY